MISGIVGGVPVEQPQALDEMTLRVHLAVQVKLQRLVVIVPFGLVGLILQGQEWIKI